MYSDIVARVDAGDGKYRYLGAGGHSPFQVPAEEYRMYRPGSAGKVLGWKCWKMRYVEPKFRNFRGSMATDSPSELGLRPPVTRSHCPPNHLECLSGYAPASLCLSLRPCAQRKTALQNNKVWSDRFFFRAIQWWGSEVEIRIGTRSNRRRKWHAWVLAMSVVLPYNHARSRKWFKMFVISWNQFVLGLKRLYRILGYYSLTK